MKDNENSKQTVKITEGDTKESSELSIEEPKLKWKQMKKPAIFLLMVVVFLGFMYLIFGSSDEKADEQKAGLNDVVPQATDGGLQPDKQKAYEQEMLEQKEMEKRAVLLSLSDYWSKEQGDSNAHLKPVLSKDEEHQTGILASANPALNSYRDIQSSLGSFYEKDNSEAIALRQEVEELKRQLSNQNHSEQNNVNNQLALMEKSYEMAARYLPMNTTQQSGQVSEDTLAKNEQRSPVQPMYGKKNKVVSGLYKPALGQEHIDNWTENRNMRFFSVGRKDVDVISKNSINACVHETQTISENNGVHIRLSEPVRISGFDIPKGHLFTALAKFQGSRLQLLITSVEYGGNIIPVEITAFDMDVQQGLYVPYSPERNALTEIVANMGTTAGTNLSLNSSTGQQIAADLSKSAVQGVSGYFAKKVRTQKVTLKAGYKLYLVSKK